MAGGGREDAGSIDIAEIIARLQLEPFWKSVEEIRSMTDAQVDNLLRFAAKIYEPSPDPESEPSVSDRGAQMVAPTGDPKEAAKAKFIQAVTALAADPQAAERGFEYQWSIRDADQPGAR